MVGDLDILVDGDVSEWKVGDEIVIAPTGLSPSDHEYRVITAINSQQITLNKTLEMYHYGSSDLSEYRINGYDIRGEIMHMTRNIKIIGTNVDDWGCHILAHDFTDVDGSKVVSKTHMHWVEMYNCTQRNTNHANIRFEMVNRYDNHTVEDCSFHHGLGRAFEFTQARGISVKRNNIYSFK